MKKQNRKMTKIKLAIKLMQDQDQRISLVREFHERKMKSTSFSIFKDATKYAVKILSENQMLLFSPGFKSFDQFNNFEERGIYFKNLIKKKFNKG